MESIQDHNDVVWFRVHTVPADDQSNEWCACCIIAAGSDEAALSWGDRLAADYCRQQDGCEFLRSSRDPEPWERAAVPRLTVGVVSPDGLIGW